MKQISHVKLSNICHDEEETLLLLTQMISSHRREHGTAWSGRERAGSVGTSRNHIGAEFTLDPEPKQEKGELPQKQGGMFTCGSWL